MNKPSSNLEADYWNQCELMRTDIFAAITCFFTFIEIHRCAAEDKSILRAVRKFAGYWNTQLHCLQTTFFIILARLFDSGPDTYSLHKLLTATLENPAFFARSALGARKLKAFKNKNTDWLEKYLEEAWEPTIKELRAIKVSLKPYTKKFTEIYGPIRHTVFAHKILSDRELVSALFAKTQTDEIDKLLFFLFDLTERLWQLYQNGRRLEDENIALFEREKLRIQENVRGVLTLLATGLEHSKET